MSILYFCIYIVTWSRNRLNFIIIVLKQKTCVGSSVLMLSDVSADMKKKQKKKKTTQEEEEERTAEEEEELEKQKVRVESRHV